MVSGMNRAFLAALPLILSSCGPAGNDPGPGGVTVDEAKALDDAAEMLDQRRLPEDALPQGSGGPAPAPTRTPTTTPTTAPSAAPQ